MTGGGFNSGYFTMIGFKVDFIYGNSFKGSNGFISKSFSSNITSSSRIWSFSLAESISETIFNFFSNSIISFSSVSKPLS